MNGRLARAFVAGVTAAMGVNFALTGLAMLLAPQFFYDTIGTFPPYNRHYIGDLGAYSLPMGLALLWAARDPLRHRLLIAAATGISLLHAANHVYDDALLGVFPSLQTLLLLAGAGVLVAVLATSPAPHTPA